MDPIVQAAAVTAGAKMLTTFVQEWNASRAPDKDQEKLGNWLKKKDNKTKKSNYDALREALSDDSVRLLDHIDSGKRLRVGDFYNVLYEKYDLTRKGVELVKKEMKYRLNYLSALGLIRPLPSIWRFQITRLGVAFLAEARARRHFPTELRQ
jgi:hypothetical protein